MHNTVDFDGILDAARAALRQAWDADVTMYLQRPIRSEWGRHTLLLCNVDGGADRPATVVVKAAVERNGAIFNEWAVLEWLARITGVSHMVPEVYGGDGDAQLIVVEDLGAGPSLHRVLQTRPDWATDALVETQRLLGTLHSATRGRTHELSEHRAAFPPGPPPPAIHTSVEAMQRELEAWDGTLAADQVNELATAAATLSTPPSFTCLTFHDACPVNRIVTPRGVRAIDLEMAGFRHPLIDGAYAAIGHLRCSVSRLRDGDGLAFPPEVRSLATEAYRRAVVNGYPEYESDDRFHNDLAAAATAWMVEILRRTRPKVEGDRPRRFFGVAACQRTIAVLAAFSVMAAHYERKPGLAAWADQLRRRLEEEWPDHPPLPVAAGLT